MDNLDRMYNAYYEERRSVGRVQAMKNSYEKVNDFVLGLAIIITIFVIVLVILATLP